MKDKMKLLTERMEKYAGEGICLAFSGGVDSSLLLKLAADAAKKTGGQVLAVTFDTRLHPPCDLEIAKKVAGELGAVHIVMTVDELDQEEIRWNPPDRCYLCKRRLFTSLREVAGKRGAKLIMDGTNADDLLVYRPGIRALKELGIVSPLAELGVTKREIQELAAALKVSTASRPSSPCMATRLPYGAELNYEVLDKIALGEELIKKTVGGNVRLRLHKDVARIEVDPENLAAVVKDRDVLTSELKKIGFPYISLDLEGFRSGSMDICLKKAER